MNLFGFHISLSRNQKSEIRNQKSIDPGLQAWLRGENIDHTCSTLSNAYQQVVWVYRAINVLAEQVANIPFLFSRGERGRESLITTGPLHDFYNRPHPHFNRFQYWERRHRLVAAKTGFDMGIPLNELNRVFDLGFKEFPWGNTGYLKSSLAPAGQIEPSSSSFSSSSSTLSSSSPKPNPSH
jgi:hypothetical protein